MDLLLRFLIGGTVVSAFALAGDLFKPASFAGLFAAAPSVALASLALTIGAQGAKYASVECRSMLAGAVALGVYAWVVCRLLTKRKSEVFPATLCAMGAWFLTAFGLWLGWLR